MPAYQQSTAQLPLQALWPGSSVDVFSAEAVASGERSQAVALSNFPQGGATPLSVDLAFNQPPGSFQINVTFAAKDVPGDYACPDQTFEITAANLDTASGGPNNAVHFECPYSNGRFVSLDVVEAPTAGGTTLTATLKR
jgi:hypothetical protein